MYENELNEMRQQMAILKNKLDRQEIVNDHIIRRSMKRNVGNIKRRYYAVIALALLMIPYGYWAFLKLVGFSFAFWVGTSIFMLICAGATYYNCLIVSDANMMHRNLVDAGKKVARAKKFDADWLFFGIPSVILWFGWFVYEIYKMNNGSLDEGLFWGGVVGGIIGAIAGFRIHFKTQRQYQEIIDNIEELTEE
jgi:hypothetical protein